MTPHRSQITLLCGTSLASQMAKYIIIRHISESAKNTINQIYSTVFQASYIYILRESFRSTWNKIRHNYLIVYKPGASTPTKRTIKFKLYDSVRKTCRLKLYRGIQCRIIEFYNLSKIHF